MGHEYRRSRRPERYTHWSPADIARIEAARLAITPFTVGESRAGWIKAGWDADKIREWEDRFIRTYGLVPLDDQVVDEFARLYAWCLDNGVEVKKHNDVWIAATAISRGLPLVSCDLAQCQLPGLDAIHLRPSA